MDGKSNADCSKNTGKYANSKKDTKNSVGSEAKFIENGTKNTEKPKNSKNFGNAKNQKNSQKKSNVANSKTA